MLRWVDSFSHYTTVAGPDHLEAKYTGANSNFSAVSATGGRLEGGYWASLFGPTKTHKKQLGQNFIIMGMAWQPLSLVNGIMRLGVSGDHANNNPNLGPYTFPAVGIEVVNDGTMNLVYNGYVITTSAGVETWTLEFSHGAQFSLPGSQMIQVGRWYYVELKLSWGAAPHRPFAAEVRVDEQLLITESPVWTDLNTGTQYDMNLGGFGYLASAFGGDGKYCDYYVLDDVGTDNVDYLGDIHVEALFPRADGTYAQWTPDTGAVHYSRVNEHDPDQDLTTVGTNSVGAKDTFFFDPVATLGDIYGVQVNNWARKQDAGARQICATMRHSGTDVDSPVNDALQTDYADHTHIFERDPANALWTPTTVDASEFGVKLVL